MSGPRAGTLVSTGEELLLSDRTSGQVRRLILLLSGDIEENPGPDNSNMNEEFQISENEQPLTVEEKLAIITFTDEIDMLD